MFTTQLHRFAAAKDLFSMVSGLNTGSSMMGSSRATSSSVMRWPSNRSSCVLNWSTFAIIFLALSQLKFRFSPLSIISTHLVTLSTPDGGLDMLFSSVRLYHANGTPRTSTGRNRCHCEVRSANVLRCVACTDAPAHLALLKQSTAALDSSRAGCATASSALASASMAAAS